jgi:2-polyprenyl-3-methyl-5-hydroxy-6-metoxy-1,4-benzoquinol methylase
MSALACAEETGILDHLGEPGTAPAIGERAGTPPSLTEAILDVLVGLGLVRREGETFSAEPGLAAAAGGRPRELLRAELRSNLLQSFDVVEAAKRGELSTGWHHSDPQILEAQGIRSVGPVPPWVRLVFPNLEGLSERLASPTAAFLDVGTGVGALAIETCRHFPHLRIVGIDPLLPALAEARRNVQEAGLAARIELREQRVEDLEDESSFDLAHVPIFFLETPAVSDGLSRVLRALRPGGWVLMQVLAASGSDLSSSMLRLLCVLWGSEPVVPEQAARIAEAAGYECVEVLPPLPGPPIRVVVGRRPA